MSNTITPTVFYRTLNVDGLEMFYREAGLRDAPTVLLLHGFPSSSHTPKRTDLFVKRVTSSSLRSKGLEAL